MHNAPDIKTSRNVSLSVLLFIWLQGIAGIIGWIYIVADFIHGSSILYDTPVLFADFIVRSITFLFASVTGIYIITKSSRTRTSLIYALVIIAWSNVEALFAFNLNDALGVAGPYIYDFEYALLFVIGVRMAQEFPAHLVPAHIAHVYYRSGARFMVRPLAWLLKGNRTWLIIFPSAMALLLSGQTAMVKLYSIFLISLFLLYTAAQHRICNPRQVRLLYWVIWSAVCQFFISLCKFLLILYHIKDGGEIAMILTMAGCFTLLMSTVMIVYFSDMLDAGLILRKTLSYGLLFFIVTSAFGSLEHYVIHNISSWLHLNDVYVVSLFAGITGLCVHPLKKKLERLSKFIIKKHPQVHGEHAIQPAIATPPLPEIIQA